MTETISVQEIKITEKAACQIAKVKNENQIPEYYGLRVGVNGGGCSGLSYSLGFEETPREGDSIIEEFGTKLFVDGKSLFYLAGTMLDFSDGLNGRGFVFDNPKAQKTRGCKSLSRV